MPLETDKSGGFKLPLGQEIKTGIHRGLFSRSVPLWTLGENVIATDYGISKAPGYDLVVNVGAGPIRGIHQQVEGDDNVIYAGNLTNLYRIVDSVSTSVGASYTLSEYAGGSVWDSGSSTWDGGTTIFDDGVVGPSHWSIINYGTFVLATNGRDSPQIKKGDGPFVNMPSGVTGISITNAGTGYVVGDSLTLTGGDGTGATAEVYAVDGAGGITSVAVTSAGSSYTTPPTGFTGGTGTTAAFTFSVCDMDVESVDIFIVRGPHILGFNTSNNGREFIFTDADDVDSWVTTAENLAGALQIRELTSDIKAAVPLGSRIAVYGDDQMFLVNYLGNELVFGYQPALNGIGAVSKKSVVAVGPRNYGLSQQGFFVTDGAQFEYIDEDIRYWFRAVASTQLGKCTAYHDESNNVVVWHLPTDSVSITEGVAYNYKIGAWTFLIANKTAGQERSIFSYAVTGDEDGKIFLEGLSNNAAGSAMTSFIRSKPMDIGNADRVKELDSIRIGFKGSGLQYRIGWSETENGTINWTPYKAMGEGFDFDNLRTAGRWLHVEVYSNTLNANWELMALEFIGRIEGTR